MLFWINIALALLGAGGIGYKTGLWWLVPVSAVGIFAVLVVLSFGFLFLACALVDRTKVQSKESRFYRLLADCYITYIIRLGRLRICTQGMEQAPKGPVLLVSNHIHDIDPAILMHLFPRYRLSFISKRENQTMPVVGPVMHKLRCPLVNRENDREALKAILQAVNILKEGKNSVGVFPEGYTSLDGLLHQFRGGVFKIAQKAQVSIVVCTVQGTKEVLPKLLKGKASQVRVHLVGVLEPQDIQGRTAIDVAGQVYEMMISDLGEQFRPKAAENT